MLANRPTGPVASPLRGKEGGGPQGHARCSRRRGLACRLEALRSRLALIAGVDYGGLADAVELRKASLSPKFIKTNRSGSHRAYSRPIAAASFSLMGFPPMSASPPIATELRTSLEVRFVPCVDGSGLARRIFTSQAWSVQP